MSSARTSTLLLGFPEYRDPARRVARLAGHDYDDVQVHRFPDGESKIRLPDRLPEHVIFCRSLFQPNDKLIELELAAATARKLGVQRLTLLAPYLAYMRQDKAFHPGEAVSQQIIGAMIARQFDTLITVDPHLHRIDTLKQAVPMDDAITLHATGAIAEYLQQAFDTPLLVGPDEESEQWVSTIAGQGGFDYVIARKQRFGDRDVRIALPDHTYSGRHLVLVDDIASTGRTLEETARHLNRFKPASMAVVVTHALLVDSAMERLIAVGVDSIVSTDSIPHPTNRLSLASLLAEALSNGPDIGTRSAATTCAV